MSSKLVVTKVQAVGPTLDGTLGNLNQPTTWSSHPHCEGPWWWQRSAVPWARSVWLFLTHWARPPSQSMHLTWWPQGRWKPESPHCSPWLKPFFQALSEGLLLSQPPPPSPLIYYFLGHSWPADTKHYHFKLHSWHLRYSTDPHLVFLCSTTWSKLTTHNLYSVRNEWKPFHFGPLFYCHSIRTIN